MTWTVSLHLPLLRIPQNQPSHLSQHPAGQFFSGEGLSHSLNSLHHSPDACSWPETKFSRCQTSPRSETTSQLGPIVTLCDETRSQPRPTETASRVQGDIRALAHHITSYTRPHTCSCWVSYRHPAPRVFGLNIRSTERNLDDKFSQY